MKNPIQIRRNPIERVAIALLSVVAFLCASDAHAVEHFVASTDNPVMSTGFPGTWDGAATVVPDIVIENGTWYLFYFGQVTITGTTAIGFATSEDGVTWTRAACNPVLSGDGTGFDAIGVSSPTVRVSGGTWHMYYGAISTAVFPPNELTTGYATASEPCGPWTRRDTPVLSHGGAGEWDADAASVESIVETEDGLVMYYSGSANFLFAPNEIGVATSTDGIVWTKYDDPATTGTPYAESDPVLRLGPFGEWDSFTVWQPDVIRTGAAWEMYYAGFDTASNYAIGYATSNDGVIWTKSPNNPVFTENDDPLAAFFGIIESPHVVDTENARRLYYDYGRGPGEAIGFAISDLDADEIGDDSDNCTLLPNPLQADTNGDLIGNQCDPDIGSVAGVGVDDCQVDFSDLGFFKAAFFSTPASLNWNPDADLTSPEGSPDGVVNFVDLSRMKAHFFGSPGPSANGCN